jgi:hypothetical protein
MSGRNPLTSLPDDEPLLDFYKGTFDAAYIAVHPFFRIPGLDPLRCAHGSVVVRRSEMPEDVDLLDYSRLIDAERRLVHQVPEGDVDERAKRDGVIVPWRDVGPYCELDDARAINRALRTVILGLRPEFADEDGADRLTAFCAREQIFRPTESEFQPICEDRLVSLFEQAGCGRVILGDEFGDHDIPKPLDFLRTEQAWAERADWPPIYGVRRLYAEDRSMIAIVPWDQFFTVIAMTAERATHTRVESLFEGFWCDDATTLSWWRDPPRPLITPAD